MQTLHLLSELRSLCDVTHSTGASPRFSERHHPQPGVGFALSRLLLSLSTSSHFGTFNKQSIAFDQVDWKHRANCAFFLKPSREAVVAQPELKTKDYFFFLKKRGGANNMRSCSSREGRVRAPARLRCHRCRQPR